MLFFHILFLNSWICFDSILNFLKLSRILSVCKKVAYTYSRPIIPKEQRVYRTKEQKFATATQVIDDCAKDGGEEFFTEMHCVL